MQFVWVKMLKKDETIAVFYYLDRHNTKRGFNPKVNLWGFFFWFVLAV